MRNIRKCLPAALLALVLVVALLPAAASATTYYDLKIDGTRVTDANCADVLGNGVFSFDGDHTLTVRGDYTGTDEHSYPIESDINGLVIRVAQDSTISTSTLGRAMQLHGDTTITGPGTLTLDRQIFLVGNTPTLRIKDTCVVVSDNYGAALQGSTGNDAFPKLVLNNASLTATGTNGSNAISSFKGGVEFHGCAIVQPQGAIIEEGTVKQSDGSAAAQVTVAPAYEAYDLTVGGVAVNTGNRANILGNGVFSFDGEHTLTVSGDCDGDGTVVDSGVPGLVVNVAQNSSLSAAEGAVMTLRESATITGSGALSLTTPGDHAICVSGHRLNVSGATISATAASVAIAGEGEASLRFVDAYANAVSTDGASAAISGFGGGITMEGCGIEQPLGGKVAAGAVAQGDGSTAAAVRIAVPTQYGVYVNGNKVDSVNRYDVLGDGVFSFDGDHTLTVSGACAEDHATIVAAMPGLVIYVAQDSTLSATGTSCGIYVDADTTITGPGALTVTAEGGFGIRVKENCSLTLNDADVSVTASNYPIVGQTGSSLVVRHSDLTANAQNTNLAITSFGGGITLESSFIETPENGRVSNGSVVTYGGSYANPVSIRRFDVYDFTVDGAQVTSANQTDILGNGVFSFDGDHTLTVSGSHTCSGSSANILRSWLPGLVVNVAADSVLDGDGRDGFLLLEDATVTGKGALTVLGNNSGVYVKNGSTLTIENADVSFTASYPVSGSNDGETLVIRNSALTATGTGSSPAVSDFDGGITLDACTIVDPEGASIENGTVKTGAGGMAKTVVISPQTYGLTIDGVTVNGQNRADVLKNGVFSFDGDHTLTISGSYTGGGVASDILRSELAGLVINVTADAELNCGVKDGLYLTADATITGPGALSVVAKGTGVYVKNGSTLTIENTDVSFTGAFPVTGSSHGETLVLRCAALTATATGSNSAVSDFSGGIELEDCEITEPDGALVENGKIKTSVGGNATTVVIAPASYPLIIGGVTVNIRNQADVLGDGAFSFDPEQNVLTVSDSYIGDGSSDIIHSELAGLVIETTADVTLDGNGAYGVTLDADTTITGSGSLIVVGDTCGVWVTGGSTLTIENIRFSVVANDYPLSGNGGEALVLRNVTLAATSTEGRAAISDFDSITLSGCGVVLPAGGKVTNGAVTTENGGTASSVTITRVYPLTIDGVAVNEFNREDVLGNGIFSFDGDHTLTISGSYTGGGDLVVSSLPGLVIETTIDAELESPSGDGLFLKANTTLTGSGTLSVVGGVDGVYVVNGSTLTIRDTTVSFTGPYAMTSSVVTGAALAIRDAVVTAISTGDQPAISNFSLGIGSPECIFIGAENYLNDEGTITMSDGSVATNVTLTATSVPVVTAQPKSQTVPVGGTATFTVAATGAGELSYQWYVKKTAEGDWSTITGATAESYILSVKDRHNGYQYKCKVTCGVKASWSDVATLTVGEPLSITAQPTNQSVTAGQTATFTVAATGAGELSYQWYVKKTAEGDWAAVKSDDGKLASYSFTAQAKHNGYQYKCKVTAAGGGELWSSVVTLTVGEQPSLSITAQPTNQSVTVGQTATFTVAAAGAGELTYQWYVKKTAEGDWAAVKSDDGKLASYSFTAQAKHNGYQYKCKVTAAGGGEVWSSVVTLTVSEQPSLSITSQPTNQSVTAGQTATFTVAATGAGELTYQWYVKKTAEGDWAAVKSDEGKLASYALTAQAKHNGYQYKCKVTAAGGGEVWSSVVTLTVSEQPSLSITAQPTNQTVTEGQTATFEAVAAGAGELSYQWYVKKTVDGEWTAVKADSAKTASYSLTAQLKHNGYQYKCYVTDGVNEAWTDVVTLTVNAAALKITSQPVNQSVAAGSAATFTVAATSADPLSYQWYVKKTVDGDWAAVKSDDGKLASYTLTAQAKHNGYQYKCYVTAGGSELWSDVATLTVS